MIFRTRTLQGYVFKEFLKALVLSLSATSLMFLLITLFVIRAPLEDFGISLGQMAMLSPFLAPVALGQAIPLACMIAAIMVFGRMAADNEILAAQSGGISINRILAPVMSFALLISVFGLWLNDAGTTWCYAAIREVLFNVNRPEVQQRIGKEGQNFTVTQDDGTIYSVNFLPRPENADPQDRPVMISKFTKGLPVQSIYARRFEFQFQAPERVGTKITQSIAFQFWETQLFLENLRYIEMGKLDLTIQLPTFSEEKFSLGNTPGQSGWRVNYVKATTMKNNRNERRRFTMERAADFGALVIAGSPGDPFAEAQVSNSFADMRAASDANAGIADRIRKQEVEFHKKLSLSFMPFSLVLLGVGLGLLVRKSNRLLGFVVGVIAYMILHVFLSMIMKEISTLRIVGAWVMWMPNLLILALGIFFVRRYEHETTSAIFGQLWFLFGRTLRGFWDFLMRIDLTVLWPFAGTATRHVARTFIVPMIVVAMGFPALYVATDLAQNGSDVVQGIVNAEKPPSPLLPRSQPEAIVDALEFYGIRALDILFEFWPAVVMIAGLLSVVVLVRNNEHLILKSSGYPLQRGLMPILLITALCSVGIVVMRQTIMPDLTVEQNRLKPLVYLKTPKPSSTAGQARDSEGHQVVYEISSYSRSTGTCDGFRICYPYDAFTGRITRLEADRAVWDKTEQCWRLFSLDPATKKLLLKKPDLNKVKGPELTHGIRYSFQKQDKPGDALSYSQEMTQVGTFAGTLTPTFIQSQSMGPQVMRIQELWELRDHKEFACEIWRRGVEWLTGLLMLMCSIPLLLRHNSSILAGIAWAILLGASYWVINIVFTELGRGEGLPPAWMPVLPHAVFLVFGIWSYNFKMQT